MFYLLGFSFSTEVEGAKSGKNGPSYPTWEEKRGGKMWGGRERGKREERREERGEEGERGKRGEEGKERKEVRREGERRGKRGEKAERKEVMEREERRGKRWGGRENRKKKGHEIAEEWKEGLVFCRHDKDTRFSCRPYRFPYKGSIVPVVCGPAWLKRDGIVLSCNATCDLINDSTPCLVKLDINISQMLLGHPRQSMLACVLTRGQRDQSRNHFT